MYISRRPHSPTDSRLRFEKALNQLAPALEVLSVAESTTDAVNSAFDIAAYCGLQRRYPSGRSPRGVPTLAFLDGGYGGAHGMAAGMPALGLVPEHGRHKVMRQFRLPDTTTLRRLRAARVFEGIDGRRLVRNAAIVGKHLVAALRVLDGEFELDLRLSGTGLLLGMRPPVELTDLVSTVFTTDSERRRILPRLTRTKLDGDGLIADLRDRLSRRSA